MEELQFLSDLTVIALLGLFEQQQILIQHLLLWEGDAVKPCQLRTFYITTPVSTGSRQYFYRLDIGGVGEVWSPAQVGKTPLGIGGDGTVFQFVDQFYLIILMPVGEHIDSICLGNAFTYNIFFGGDQFHHLLFDGGEIRLLDGYPFTRIHIVIETVLDGRANTKFNAWI